ncbi:hypothetical protein LCGC14_0957600 [marine sediment metagenome]|uniref:Uncharacterized protein n=1 Tax=marine sediment metagenome TaxID=412755 RepID=A0A0F9QYW0_9ZZZZ
MFQKLKKYIRKRAVRKAFDNVRSHLLFFGCDVSHLSDEELIERIHIMHKVIASAGLTVKEASEALALSFITKKAGKGEL